jgi:hypothetical protein
MLMPAMSGARFFMVSRLARLLTAFAIAFAATAAYAQTVSRPFASLRPASGAAAAAHALVVELSPREVLSGAHIELASSATPPAGDRYLVWINGALIVNTEATGAHQTLELAPNAFAPGVNTIQLALAPNGAPVANALALTASAPIDDSNSRLSLDFAGMRANPAPTLAQLSLAFDSHAWLPRTVAVDLGEGAAAPTPAQVQAASLAVESVATRMRQIDVTVTYRSEGSVADWSRDPESWGVAKEDTAAGDTLLVGTRAALSHELPASIAHAVTGPFLGIYPANAGRSVVVVISGLTDADCLHAAHVFADPVASLPASAAMVIDRGYAGQAGHAGPAPHLAMALAEEDPALVRAALRFAAVRAKATGEVADFSFRYGTEVAGIDYFFGQDAALSRKLRSRLPVYAPLQPGQAVSLPAQIDHHSFIAMIGVRNAALAGAVDMLRKPATWARFTQRATLFDTRTQAAIPLAVARRSLLAQARLFLADPLTFWLVLAALLLASFVFVNLALKAQVAARLETSGAKAPADAPGKIT